MQTLMWLRYVVQLPLFIAARLLTYPLAPIAVAFFSSDDQRTLVFPFRWMMTLDNDLDGDESWKRKNTNPWSYCTKVRWMWRNGGHALNYGLLGCRRPSAYPQHRSFTQLLGKYLELYIGWSNNIPRGKMVLTMRWRNRNY